MRQNVVKAIGLGVALLLPAALPLAAVASEMPPPERSPFHILKPALDGAEPVAATGMPLPERAPEKDKSRTDAHSTAAGAGKDETPDTWSEAEIAAAKAECERLTNGLSVEMRYVEPMRHGQCGTAQPVEVSSLGSGQKVLLVPPATMNCRMVAMLTRWLDTSVQSRAKAILGKPIVRLTNASAYVCRNRYNAKDQKLSEHAKANALDVSGFITSDGREISVAEYWGPTLAEFEAKTARTPAATSAATAEAAPANASGSTASAEPGLTAPASPPLPEQAVAMPSKGKAKSKLGKPAGLGALVKGEPLIATGSKVDRKRKRGMLVARPAEYAPKTPEGKFLQAVHADACETFGTVLGPEANYAHHDHLHLDLASRRTTNFCQ